jgi:hypothetical protein
LPEATLRGVGTDLAPAPAIERNWWLRAPAVLVAPRAVFASLRDDSDDAAEARQEALIVVAVLAGISVVLTTRTFREMLNNGSVSLVIIPVLAFIAGALYGTAVYWLVGGLLHGAARRLGSQGSYRRARHVLALAATPLAFSFVTFWPVRLAVYGEDLFRTGGEDYGRGDAVFGGVYLGFVAWSLLLLLVGVRTVHGWTWGRAAAAVALAAAFPVLIAVATSL